MPNALIVPGRGCPWSPLSRGQYAWKKFTALGAVTAVIWPVRHLITTLRIHCRPTPLSGMLPASLLSPVACRIKSERKALKRPLPVTSLVILDYARQPRYSPCVLRSCSLNLLQLHDLQLQSLSRRCKDRISVPPRLRLVR